MQDDEMQGEGGCGAYRGEKKCLRNFGEETRGKEDTPKNQA